MHAAKYTTPDRHRADQLGTVPGKDGVRLTGLSLPFDGQAVQGFSGIKNMGDGTFWSLSDNGFGNKIELGRRGADAASPQVRLGEGHGRSHRDDLPLRPGQQGAGSRSCMRAATERYLTGADFDVESIQPVADGFWIGDEFGPFLIKFDQAGKVVAMCRHAWSTASR